MIEPTPSLSTLDLEPSELDCVLQALKQHVPDCKVLAFGSRVSGNAKPFSDLDLAIVGEEPLSLGRMAALAEAFSESDLPWKVDLVDWASTSERF